MESGLPPLRSDFLGLHSFSSFSGGSFSAPGGTLTGNIVATARFPFFQVQVQCKKPEPFLVALRFTLT